MRGIGVGEREYQEEEREGEDEDKFEEGGGSIGCSWVVGGVESVWEREAEQPIFWSLDKERHGQI